MIKKIVSAVIALSLILPCSIAKAETRKDLNENENFKYWSEKFPVLDEHLEDGNIVDLAGSDEVYIKYTPKDSVNEKSVYQEHELESKVYSKDEYYSEQINNYGIGSFIPNNGKEPYWLRLDLQVYTTPTYGEYMACSFWEWKTRPAFRFTDLNGIYTSSEFVIGDSKPSNPIIANYQTLDSNGNFNTSLSPIIYSQHGNGVASTNNLKGDSDLFTYTHHMGMTQAPVEFSSTSSISGRIYTNYVHKQVAFGSPSFGIDGKPSFGLEISTDEHGGSVYISR